MLYVWPKLDLGLNASKLASLVKRYGVRSIQDVISCLKEKRLPSLFGIKVNRKLAAPSNKALPLVIQHVVRPSTGIHLSRPFKREHMMIFCQIKFL